MGMLSLFELCLQTVAFSRFKDSYLRTSLPKLVLAIVSSYVKTFNESSWVEIPVLTLKPIMYRSPARICMEHRHIKVGFLKSKRQLSLYNARNDLQVEYMLPDSIEFIFHDFEKHGIIIEGTLLKKFTIRDICNFLENITANQVWEPSDIKIQSLFIIRPAQIYNEKYLLQYWFKTQTFPDVEELRNSINRTQIPFDLCGSERRVDNFSFIRKYNIHMTRNYHCRSQKTCYVCENSRARASCMWCGKIYYDKCASETCKVDNPCKNGEMFSDLYRSLTTEGWLCIFCVENEIHLNPVAV